MRLNAVVVLVALMNVAYADSRIPAECQDHINDVKKQGLDISAVQVCRNLEPQQLGNKKVKEALVCIAYQSLNDLDTIGFPIAKDVINNIGDLDGGGFIMGGGWFDGCEIKDENIFNEIRHCFKLSSTKDKKIELEVTRTRLFFEFTDYHYAVNCEDLIELK